MIGLNNVFVIGRLLECIAWLYMKPMVRGAVGCNIWCTPIRVAGAKGLYEICYGFNQ